MAQELNLDQLAEAMRNQRHPCLRWDPTVYDRPSIHPLSIDFCNLMLAIAMRKHQEGNTNGKKVVWDKNSMTFIELNSYEQANDTQSVVNDVSKRPFYSA